MQKSKISRRREIHKSKKKLTIATPIIFAFSIIVICALFVFWKVFTIDSFVYVNRTENDAAEIVIVDNDSDRVVKYLIQADTALDSSREYGDYKMSSLWNLSNKDGNDGKLIAETILKNYYLPVYLWKDKNRSNLNFYQKIKSNIVERKSGDYEKVLETSNLSNSVLINFVNPDFLEHIPTVNIEDLTGSYSVAEKVSKIIEVVGGKITLNSKGFDESIDCVVIGKSLKSAKIFADIFGCELDTDNTMNYDIKVKLGAKFIERF